MARLKKNPLARALRLDKMTLAALEATLRLYLNPDEALRKIPTLRMLSEPADAVRSRAELLAEEVRRRLPEGCAEVAVVPETARAGGAPFPCATSTRTPRRSRSCAEAPRIASGSW